MKENQSLVETRLEDYKKPEYLIDQLKLIFTLGEDATSVKSTLSITKIDAVGKQPLVLDGEELVLKSLLLNGQTLAETDYLVDGEKLTIYQTPEKFTLEIETEIYPQKNTALEGLYQSSGNFCTQCEAQGFRKITYFPDRPDVMSRFSTTIIAEQSKYPVLLSNGNCVESKDLDNGFHQVTWEDPFPKPAYLFALVAGDLARVEDSYTTTSGREVTLHIYTEAHNISKCDHAMQSLKKSMQWDEDKFALEYDLDIYMIVAVDDFNMGAMENKGLNIFNSKFVLADQATATDVDFLNVEAVIAHEYFHNWTGNRVTCRDWFQLSLKEGLTVFRDQEFSADMNSRGLKRIEDVRMLRARQFPEDAGPTAHPVRPEAYIEINNFYTVTIYEKGAEVIRMMHTLLGADGFRKGMDLYFKRHDGQAVTCDDFAQAMQDASGVDLTQFKRWYSQAGTPHLAVNGNYNVAEKKYQLKVSQQTPDTPGQTAKQPLHIPFEVALLGQDGNELSGGTARVLNITETSQTFTFDNINEKPTPSLLRNYSAPVKLEFDYSDEALSFLMANDTDSFNRWESAQQLTTRVIKKLAEDYRQQKELTLDDSFFDAFAKLLSQASEQPALTAEALSLPTEEVVGESSTTIDIDALFAARQFLKKQLAQTFENVFENIYHSHLDSGTYQITPTAIAYRRIKNLSLSYLSSTGKTQWEQLALEQFKTATNMTDSMAALAALSDINGPNREQALTAFYTQWKDVRLVLDKWFTVQALSTLPETLTRVKTLTSHNDFEITNPNRLRSLVGAFCLSNPTQFHHASGEGYSFLADHVIKLNTINPQIAARLVTGLSRWPRYDKSRQQLMQQQLTRIIELDGLSKDVYEIVHKSLNIRSS